MLLVDVLTSTLDSLKIIQESIECNEWGNASAYYEGLCDWYGDILGFIPSESPRIGLMVKALNLLDDAIQSRDSAQAQKNIVEFKLEVEKIQNGFYGLI